MPVEEQLATIFEVLEGGIETTAEVIPFPVDAGATALEGTTTTVQLGNGIATEVSQLTVTEAGTTTTAGVGLLAMDVGAVGLAIAPALGIVAGVGLYSLAPEFWTNVSNALLDAGQTIGGKVRLFINGETKQIGVSEETLEIFKNAFINAGLYNQSYTEPEINPDTKKVNITYDVSISKVICYNYISQLQNISESHKASALSYITNYSGTSPIWVQHYYYKNDASNKYALHIWTQGSYGSLSYTTSENIGSVLINGTRLITWSIGGYLADSSYFRFILDNPSYIFNWQEAYPNKSSGTDSCCPNFGSFSYSDNIQEDAIIPNANPIPEIYPSWNPWSVPVEGFPDVYPIEIPEINPNPDQSEAQNPSALPDDNPDLLPWFITNLPQPNPNPNPYPEPSIEPDPDPQPEPDPIENPTEPDTDPNPVDPNPDPSEPFLPIIPDVPDTVPANAMFTVYKPTISQVNAFGGWLWSNNIMEAIKRIWQNPLDGIISFMKVYVDAPTSGSDTIKVGMLDSEVSSAVVTGQFVTVECGSINIKEKFYNATDYSPFVSLHVYLPFIGIVELDIDEFMNGEIKITYHVDVYTGTCLAEIKARRSYDKPEWTIIYTFSGNASQQLPLTSASFSGALSSLVSIVGGGLAIASGGGLGLLAGATGLAHAVTHEMVHLAHSGSLSANAGIMGARKPFLILTRRRSYDANGYNELYGYPSNKTVFLNNCSGFVKVKDIQLKTSATDVENKEIESLLKNGVII